MQLWWQVLNHLLNMVTWWKKVNVNSKQSQVGSRQIPVQYTPQVHVSANNHTMHSQKVDIKWCEVLQNWLGRQWSPVTYQLPLVIPENIIGQQEKWTTVNSTFSAFSSSQTTFEGDKKKDPLPASWLLYVHTVSYCLASRGANFTWLFLIFQKSLFS